jgi:predicted RND superfamily exporter protein
VLVCAVALRSVWLVGLNLAALWLALVLSALWLVLWGIELSPLSVLALPLLLGLVIDYSLHMVLALTHRGGDLRRAFAHVGSPILLTGLTACIGFGAPLVSGQPALRNFGLVMDLGIGSAVAACLVLLPGLYVAGRRGLRGGRGK